MELKALAKEYCESRAATGLLLDETECLKRLVEATRFYHGLQPVLALVELVPTEADHPTLEAVKPETQINASEWQLVRPLFVLYVERSNAVRLEASRGEGVDPYGRSSSEVAAEITIYETETLPRKAFVEAPFTVGLDEQWN